MRAGPERDVLRRRPGGIVSGGDERWEHHGALADQRARAALTGLCPLDRPLLIRDDLC
jgi:hypothetical protein